MDKWAELNAFVAVVEHRGFAPAARAISLAPSGVSRLVSNLEARLGVRLLNRTTRRVSLTEAGERYYTRGRDALASFEAAEADVAGLQSAPRGLLRVSCVVTLAERSMPAIIADFMARHPGVSVELLETDRPVDLIEEGVDVALMTGALQDSSAIVRKLSGFSRHVVASPEYWARHGRPETPAELKRHNCLRFVTAPHLQKWTFQKPGRKPFAVTVSGRFSAAGAETILQASLAGIGVSRLASFMVAPHWRSGALEEVLPDVRENEPVPLSAVFPSAKHLSLKIRAFIDHLAERFAAMPPWEDGLR